MCRVVTLLGVIGWSMTRVVTFLRIILGWFITQPSIYGVIVYFCYVMSH